MSGDLRPGDWVLVWGQVTPGSVHPEDVQVELRSHSEDYRARVRKDRVVVPPERPDFAHRCTSLFETSWGYLWRCESHEGHSGEHSGEHVLNGGSTKWSEKETTGYIEEA